MIVNQEGEAKANLEFFSWQWILLSIVCWWALIIDLYSELLLQAFLSERL